MSDIHLQKRIWFHLLCIILFVFPLVDNNDTKQLISCEQKPSRSLLFVSTLDGKISALDANNLGKKQWTLDLNGGPMLSSNIHHTELNNDGQWVRLIPSLRGGLYKFDGENLESIPISAVQLLHSSFRYSEDLVFSGGREVNSYGVSSATGKVLYECGINGCTNTNGDSYIEQDVLIVRRYQQTVRAVEPRTGIERWNFSVGQHDLVSISNSNIYCQNDKEAHTLDIEIKVVVPDGLIWATNRNNPKIKLWQYKFNSPIVTIWREDASKSNENNNLKEINLFDSMEWLRGTEFSTSPGIYLGVHDRQLYVQENAKLYKSLEVLPTYTQHLTYPWQPHLAAIGNTIVKALPGPESNNNNDDNALLKVNDTQSPTALSVLYNSEYINGNGFYLYSQDQLQVDNDKQCNRTNINSMLIAEEKKLFMSNNTLEEDDTPVQIIIVSLWYWWKEVLIISITTAILLNFVLTQRLLNATTVVKDAVLPPLIVERHIETNKTSFRIINDKESIDKFKSRYLTDFEPVDCLGKGGYGVVFEAKNKIDDCNYAIKRIALPNSQSSRERVMREVKALAKLDHQNIVRYFNAWLECPPAGWQEKHDPEWINKLILPTDLTSHAEAKVNNFVCINVSQTDQSSVESACEAYDALHNSDLDEDSLVVFEKSHSTYLNKDVIDISNYSTESSNLSRSNNVTGKVLSKIDDCTGSDSIVFKDTNSNKHSEKDENRKRQRSFSLDLNNKSNTRKSPKMFLYIQMQLCQRLSLRDWLKNQSVQDYRHVLNIFQQIVEAVEYVHLQGLIHRDLKPSNIFFSFDNKIKVGDFGLVTAMTEGYDETHTPPSQNENITLKNSLHTAYVGTHLYMSPEQMKGQCYNYKVDIYSLGIILFELLIPFVTEMERITTLINLRKSLFPKDFDANHPAEYNLLKMMLDENPSNRPTTLGIKARAPLINYEIANGLGINEDSKWHFELPQLTRHSSMTNASSSESWENIT
ncbi:eukaryotic translation initiation factor 2-alpha kinase isoform X1 [Colletes gigas]|uniref:eukaryotic translation initiation factor 2-alpha kinase isoform X1 n=1 Tax=Colletes gigas TaxID=935657 RepID=UPI001C9BBC7D|nr:eukaryotic translation initiation factor 2-alpha kinase isoform X1 [Colletes gigas]XP_043248352.1 eukaryotic translation initiation factor 2-alpha kinase isoform X1 [Colletes gigas]XP_043248353.1 eukaryotic translation initiation factor 2-alpha kinase isoform X1 [Colletes gigas]